MSDQQRAEQAWRAYFEREMRPTPDGLVSRPFDSSLHVVFVEGYLAALRGAKS